MIRPYSDRVKITMSENAIAQLRDHQFDALVSLAMNDAGQKRVENWLLETRLTGKVRVGVLAVVTDCGTKLMAYAKVVVPGKAVFIHEELYIQFPSDHFKTKILLVTGGA